MASVLVTACSVAKVDICEVRRLNLNFLAVLVAMLAVVTSVVRRLEMLAAPHALDACCPLCPIPRACPKLK